MDEITLKDKFGVTVRRLRASKNISQEKFAEIVGLHRTYISEVERGERNISLVNIAKITNGLGVSISEFFRELERGD